MRIPGPVLVGLAIVISAAGYLYLNRPEANAGRQSTEDAYVQADFTNVSSRVAGSVSAVLVDENQIVQAGEILVQLDDRDLKIAVQNAEAVVAANDASIKTINAQIVQQVTKIAQAAAALDAANAALDLARINETRTKALTEKSAASQSANDKSGAELSMAVAARSGDVAALEAAKGQVDILNGQLEAAYAALAQAHAQLSEAQLHLSYATITAPISGTIGQKSVRIGAYVGTGTALLSIVPLDQLYVRANFRETQLARVRPGQSVSVRVDALPGLMLHGTVESLGPASGTSYSAVASQNATGNFTKIAQRLPVRIRFDAGQADIAALRVGMSVIPEIRIK